MLALDPIRLDRSLARFATLRHRFVAALRSGSATDHAFELLPSGFDRELLAELDSGRERDPLAPPFRAWLAVLLLDHACLEERRHVADALRRERHLLDAPERSELSLAEMRRFALVQSRRADWLHAYEGHTASLQRARFTYWERRAERAAELGVALDRDAELAQRLIARCLEQTADAYGELRLGSLASLVDASLGHDIPGAFPRRLSPRDLGELFREGGWLSGLEPQAFELPEMLAPSSFSRALGRFGGALHDAGANRARPFVVTHDPRGLRRAEFSALFALLPCAPAFAKLRLDLGRPHSADYQRALRRVVLLALRGAAIRAELSLAAARGSEHYRRIFAERIANALGFELHPTLAGCWFVDDAAPRHFVGALAALARSRDLTERYDEDWFRNPRAIEAVRAELDEPPPGELDEARALAGLEHFVKDN